MIHPFDRVALRSDINEKALSYYPGLHRVEEYVLSHLRTGVCLAEAARVAQREYKYFSALFRSKVGIRFGEWVNMLRVRRSLDIMKAHHDSIPHIAFASGFKDVRSFERTFKKLTGLTPSEARYQLLSEHE